MILDTTDRHGQGRTTSTPTKLNYLSNDNEDFGGMMTEIVINP